MGLHWYVGFSNFVYEFLLVIAGTYDISKMHYEGFGKEPYGYNIRTETAVAA